LWCDSADDTDSTLRLTRRGPAPPRPRSPSPHSSPARCHRRRLTQPARGTKRVASAGRPPLCAADGAIIRIRRCTAGHTAQHAQASGVTGHCCRVDRGVQRLEPHRLVGCPCEQRPSPAQHPQPECVRRALPRTGRLRCCLVVRAWLCTGKLVLSVWWWVD
jgi:hypothetical protein